MGKRTLLSILGIALTLTPVACWAESNALRPVDSSEKQRASAEVPEKYIGTWVLDIEASNEEIADHAPAQVKERWLKGVADLIRYENVISADTVIASITTKTRMARVGAPERAEYRVEFKEEGTEFTILSIVGRGRSSRGPQAFHLRLVDDGSLRIRASTAKGWADDDELTRHFVWRKETGGASAGAGRGTNKAVAYLDALKKCGPGQFHFSYPGLSDFRNTIVGRADERCQVKIVHSNMEYGVLVQRRDDRPADQRQEL